MELREKMIASGEVPPDYSEDEDDDPASIALNK